ncbi:MAG: hypothetical protein WAX69_11900 [Victivallales bacterium]
MNKAMFTAMMLMAMFCCAAALQAIDILSDEGVKCSYSHRDRWKGRTDAEGILFLAMNGGDERIYIIWGKSRDELLQKEGFSTRKENTEKNEKAIAAPPVYQEFTDILKKAVEWEATADANDLEDVQKPMALGWIYSKLKKGTPGWISRTWGNDITYELVEIKISEIPRLLKLFEGVPGMEKKMQEENKQLKEESDRKKAEEKEKQDKVDSLLK